jgi:hypothetical protein
MSVPRVVELDEGSSHSPGPERGLRYRPVGAGPASAAAES